MIAKTKKSTSITNKAATIREAFRLYGLDATAKQVMQLAAKHGLTVAPAQISNIRTKLKGGATSGKKAGGSIASHELLKAHEMAKQLGGVGRARELLGILEKLA